MSETNLQNQSSIIMSQYGGFLWRNNVGAATDPSGRVIFYGLGNISKKQNKIITSSDGIGLVPYRVQPRDVGHVLGVFVASEFKRPGWVFSMADSRAVAQATFHDAVRSAGGLAGFARSTDDFKLIIKR